MGAEPSTVKLAAKKLLETRERLMRESPSGLQARVVHCLDELASRLLNDPQAVLSKRIEQAPQFDATWLSLGALLKSWRAAELQALIIDEGVERAIGPKVVAHFVASNTPLLAWTSVARALLVQAGSIVRLPYAASTVAAWSEEFVNQVARIDPDISQLIALRTWPKQNLGCTTALCEAADTVLVYGSDETVRSIRSLTPPQKRFLGFGSKISLAFFLKGAPLESVAGTASDMWINDQQGCLSPQCVLVEGDRAECERVAQALAAALGEIAARFPKRTMAQAASIREFTDIARMQYTTQIYQASDLAWTVALCSERGIELAGPPGCIWIRPLDRTHVGQLLESCRGRIQGASVGTANSCEYEQFKLELDSYGVSYICSQGSLQLPPFTWREDGHDVLRSLI